MHIRSMVVIKDKTINYVLLCVLPEDTSGHIHCDSANTYWKNTVTHDQYYRKNTYHIAQKTAISL